MPAMRKFAPMIRHALNRSAYSTVVPATVSDRWHHAQNRDIVLIDGVRTPFMVAGTKMADPELSAVELAKRSLLELHNRSGVPMDQVQYMVLGNVLTDLTYTNMTRNAALLAGYTSSIPGHTVNMACMSSIQSITTCVAHMKSGPLDICVAGGSEYLSDIPIRLPPQLRRALIKSRRVKGWWQRAAMITKSSLSSLVPEIPDFREYTTGELIAVTAQRLGILMNVSRQEQDEFALRSHMLAAAAYERGYINDVMPIRLHGGKETFDRDNGIRHTSMEQLARLKPAFPDSVPNPTMTAGNCTFMTDGAAACMLMTEERAKAMGLKPKVFIRDFIYVAQNPISLPLSGGVFAIPSILERCNLTMNDIDVWEVLEDYAAQVVGNFKAMDSDWFARKYMNRSEKVGLPPLEKLNTWGGSLAMGHPIGATGVRLLMHAANRLIAEDKQLACIMGCAMGGQGMAMIVERHPDATR